MTRIFCRAVIIACLYPSCVAASWSQAYPSASLTIRGLEHPGGSGIITISFNGHNHSVLYGPYSTTASIASAFAADFSAYPASAWPRLCTIGLCAKSYGSTIMFQLTPSSSQFGAVATTSTGSSFDVDSSAWPSAISGPAATSIVLASSANPIITNAPVTFVATVFVPSGSGVPSGSVSFADGTSSLGSGPLSAASSASFTTATLASGSHTITAQYSGNTSFSASTSAPLHEIVSSGNEGGLQVSPGSAAPGMLVQLSGVSFGTVRGSVTFGTINAAIQLWTPDLVLAVVPPGSGTVNLILSTSVNNYQTSFTTTSAAPTLACPVY